MNADNLKETSSAESEHDFLMRRYVRSAGALLPPTLLSGLEVQLSATLGDAGFRDLCTAVGREWANLERERFESSETLSSLTDRFNTYWAESRWGWVHLEEIQDGIKIVHCAAPSGGANHVIANVLAGFYDAAFKQLGAHPDMTLLVDSVSDHGFSINLQLTG